MDFPAFVFLIAPPASLPCAFHRILVFSSSIMAIQNGVNGVNGINGTHHTRSIAAFDPPSYPPFPSDTKPTLVLDNISLSKILLEDAAEKSRMLDICKAHGFFYLDFSDTDVASIVDESNQVGKLAETTFALPAEEKERFPYQPGTIFG